MSVYTSAAREEAGGTEAIRAAIDLRVVETNHAYLKSGVVQQLHLVWTAEVDYSAGPSNVSPLDRLIDPTDGYMDAVHVMRDRYAADLVHLIIDNSFTRSGSNCTGEAKLVRDPFSEDAAERTPFSSTTTGCDSVVFAHETGHSMGLRHDRYAEIHACCGRLNMAYPYSHGYVNQRAFEPDAPASSRWQTIMTSNSQQCHDAGFSCERLLRFSNPDLTYNGDPMGVLGDKPTANVDGPADARRSLNETRRAVANFRVAPPDDGRPTTPTEPGRTAPPTLDLTCHGYDEGATRAYNCIPEPSQQRFMGTFVPAVGSACDRGSIADFPPGRIVFQIRCRDGSPGPSAAWSYSGRGPASFVTPAGTARVRIRTSFPGSSVRLSVWCRAPQEHLVVNELLGAAWGNDGTSGIYGMAGCREGAVDTAREDLQWGFAQELAATALTPPRSWERVSGAGGDLSAEALQDLAAATELERRWRRPGRFWMNPRPGASTRGAAPTFDADDGAAPFRATTRTVPLTLDLTCHGYDEGATRAYNCIPEPSQQHHMRTFVPAVGSACDQGSIAEFPPGRIVFQIRCRDPGGGQSAAWSHAGRGPAFFEKSTDTPRVWVRTSFSGSSVGLSVWCRAPQEHLVVNELLGRSWGNDGTEGLYDLAGCREVEVDTAEGENVRWSFTEELAATALTPPRSWEQASDTGMALSPEARQDLATATALERLRPRPGR